MLPFLFPSLVLHGEIAVSMKWGLEGHCPIRGLAMFRVPLCATCCLRDGKSQVLLGLNSNVCRLNQVVKSQFLLVAMSV